MSGVLVRIPKEIPDSAFRLDGDERVAAVIWDWDKHRLLRSAPGLARAHTLRKTIREVFMLLSLVTVVVTIGFVRRRSGAAGRSADH